MELTKLEAKQSFIDCQDDTESNDQRLYDFEELWKAVFDVPMKNGKTANMQNIQFVKIHPVTGIFDRLETAFEERFCVIFASAQKCDAIRKQRMAEINAMKESKKKKGGKRKKR